MPHTTRTMISLARSAAIVALIGAPVVAAPLLFAHAQTKATPAATSPNGENAANVEARIKQLHTELKITPEQESKWNSVAQAMRDNASNMDKLVAQKRQQGPQSMTAVDDLKTAQEFTQAQLDGLKNLTSAFSTLYDSMSDAQKKNADQVLAKANHPPGAAPNRNG